MHHAYLGLLCAVPAAYLLPVFAHEISPISPKWHYLFQQRRTVLFHLLASIIFLSADFSHFFNKTTSTACIIWGAYMFGIKIGKKTINLRTLLPKMKPFTVALVWSLVFSALFEEKNKESFHFEAFFEIFFFIAGLTLTFEIRDGTTDKKSGLSTLGNIFSEKKILFISFMLVQLSFCFGGNLNFSLCSRLFSQILLTFIYLLPFLLPSLLKKESFYTVLLDSSIGLVGFFYLCLT